MQLLLEGWKEYKDMHCISVASSVGLNANASMNQSIECQLEIDNGCTQVHVYF